MKRLTRKNHDLGSDGRRETVDKLSEKPYGWLDRRRWTIQLLEEAIGQARDMSRAKGGRGHDKQSRLEWTKTLSRLLEIYAAELKDLKGELWSRSLELASPLADNTMAFERRFQQLLLEPWQPENLELTCEDCGVSSIFVQKCSIYNGEDNEDHILCGSCYAKRKAQAPKEE